MTESNRKTGKLTLATEAALIIREEYMARAAAELTALSDEELQPRMRARLAENIGYKDGAEWPAYVPKPETMSREDMIEILASEAGGYPPTFAIGEDDDDPLVDAARELRREGWERNVTWIIRTMRLTGSAADRHRAAAEGAELAFLRRLMAPSRARPAQRRVAALLSSVYYWVVS